MSSCRWPLMRNNVSLADLNELSGFIKTGFYPASGHKISEALPRLTQGPQVAAFEREFAQWLGVRHAVMVNSGASANLITMAALKARYGPGEVIVPAICWSSDIASVLHAGLDPVFVDVDPQTLGMDFGQAFEKITERTRAVFITHVLGFNALQPGICGRLGAMGIEVVEDTCEAIGATMDGRKLGTFGLMSNFSFYYAHHMSTIEGGMVCTDSDYLNNVLRMLRSHGMVREAPSQVVREYHEAENPGLHPEFIFAISGYNVRSTEINAVIGRSQLKRLDAGNTLRTSNLMTWLSKLDPARYVTDYRIEGSSNYALPLVLRKPDGAFMERMLEWLRVAGVEYRRGTAGGGNQLRQPYLRHLGIDPSQFPAAEHVHCFGLYLGNYPSLDPQMIANLCEKLNSL